MNSVQNFTGHPGAMGRPGQRCDSARPWRGGPWIFLARCGCGREHGGLSGQNLNPTCMLCRSVIIWGVVPDWIRSASQTRDRQPGIRGGRRHDRHGPAC